MTNTKRASDETYEDRISKHIIKNIHGGASSLVYYNDALKVAKEFDMEVKKLEQRIKDLEQKVEDLENLVIEMQEMGDI